MKQLETTVTPQLVYTVDQVATAMGKGRNFIYDQMAAGRLKSFKLGNSRRILHGDLLAFLNAERSVAESKASPLRVARA